MDSARIAELLAPFLTPEEPSADLLCNISTYIDILLRWNARINLTAIRNPEEIVTRHFGESLFAARILQNCVGTASPGCPAERSSAVIDPMSHPAEHNREGHGFSRADSTQETSGASAPEVSSQPVGPDARSVSSPPSKSSWKSGASVPALSSSKGPRKGPEKNGALAPVRLADLGSGAGFPGLPIKLWAPHLSVTLIESNHKKATFLREVARALTLTDINIQTARAETLTNTFDIVTLRAVEHFGKVLQVASTLLAPGGLLALLIGTSQLEEAQASLPAYAWNHPLAIPNSTSRTLLLGCKDSST